MSQSERLARVRLARSSNVGPVTFRKVLERFGTAHQAIEALPALIAKTGGKRAITLASRDAAVAEIETALAIGAKPVIWGDAEYPDALAAIADAPPFFYVMGRMELLSKPAVGIVGARNASTHGCQFARKLATDLCQAGYVVTSGMARGIDGAAHDGALACGGTDGGTIAVLAGGVDVVYPRENAKLHAQLCETGCVISEMPPGLSPQARHFPRRNRIISGLALGVIVIEAGRNSGSLITARMAADQGREVFAVPGSPADPRASGPNSLIRDGATLCDSADVVINQLRGLHTASHFQDQKLFFDRNGVPDGAHKHVGDIEDILQSLDAENSIADTQTRQNRGLPENDDDAPPLDVASQLMEFLSLAPLPVDTLIRVSKQPAAMVSTLLIELELAGRVERHPGNRVSRIAD
ncbi:DNA-processing protein DprA [Thalassospira sp.]|uniref:DNA-processing protein DprA n=1 Tax=Thalassospira sp. TaxID=1912094 RepID=UPI002735B6FD|nr:DNA-processing protein DprA [Thalassospira sp.]MDP2698081.1 DNA-processing protein DprA [Thalassospira sp.]